MSKKRHSLRRRAGLGSLFTGIFLLSAASNGHAAKYEVHELGPTLQSYSEHRMGLNAANDVAWSELHQGTFKARVTPGGILPVVNVDLHLAAGSPVRSYAEDLNDDKHVVGYTSTSARETFSSAALWLKVGANYIYINLGADTKTQISGAQAQTSAAYAISPKNNAGNYYVAGYAREVAGGTNATPSQPVVWEITPTGTVLSMTTLNLGGFAGGYGVAYGVTAEGKVAGAAAPTGGYLNAVIWDGLAQPASVIPTLGVSGTPAAGDVASSVANRIRTIDLGGVQTVDVVVGHAFIMPTGLAPNAPPSARLQTDVEGFVFRVGDPQPDNSFSLGGSKSGLMDVGVQVFGEGMIGETAAPRPVGFSVGTGISFPNQGQATSQMATQGAQRAEIGPHALTCNVNDALPSANLHSLRSIQATNTHGSFAGWRADGQAVRVTEVPAAGNLELQVRKTPGLLGQPARSQFWVRYTGPGDLKEVQLSHSAGCAALASSCGDGRMDLSDGTGGATAIRLSGDASNAQKISARGSLDLIDAGHNYPSTKFGWMQAVIGASADCGLTPVVPVSEEINPAGADAWGGFWCDKNATVGAETNIRENLDACSTGSCGSETAVASYGCADRQCNDGVHHQSIHAGSCLIGTQCYLDKQINPLAGNTFTMVESFPLWNSGPFTRTVPNPCTRCLSATSNTSWTTLTNADTICCDSSGKPKLDPYDIAGNERFGSDVNRNTDNNGGRNQDAYWLDERNRSGGSYDPWQSYYQGSLWSKNDDCNLHSSTTEPQVLDRGHDSSSAGHVRRIRAHFTPGIDESDWYAVVFDDSPHDAVTPKPRGRLISHNNHPSDPTRKVRLQMCMYLSPMHGGRGDMDIRRVYYRAGRGKFYATRDAATASYYLPLTSMSQMVNWANNYEWLFDHEATFNYQWNKATWPSPPPGGNGSSTDYYYHAHANRAGDNSPALKGRGPCFETDDNGVLDYSIYDYIGRANREDEVWAYYAISLVDTNVEEAMCDDIKYTLYYGNDRDSQRGFGWNSPGTGCTDCCDEGPW